MNTHFSKSNSTITNGFTLVEVLVSLALFVTAITMGIAVVVSMNDASRKNRTKDQTLQSAYFLMDSITRSARTGDQFTCLSSGGSPIAAASCSATIQPGFRFCDQSGRVVSYRFVSETDISSGQQYGVIKRTRSQSTDCSGSNPGAEEYLHSPDALRFKTNQSSGVVEAGFLATGYESSPHDNSQPIVSIRGNIQYQYKGQTYSLPLQTSITQRRLDYEQPF